MMWVLHVIQTCSKICAIVLILINFSSSENISESLSVNRTNHSVKHVPTNRISSRLNNIETIPLYKLLQQKNLTVENTELIKASWPQKIFQCIRSRNIFQCMKIFLLQRSEIALERINMNQLSKTNISWFDDILTLQNDSSVDFSKYENLTNSELNEQIIGNLFQIYDQRLIKFQLLSGVSFQIFPNNTNGTFDLAIRFNKDENSRGMKMKNIMPILLIPSVISTTFLPLMLPGIKMMVMFVMMINQMAFSMALMSLIRGMIFGPRVEDEIVYVNKGYQNEKKHHHPPPSLIVPSGGGGPPIGHHEEPIHFGDASQVSLAKQEPPLIINSMPENFHNLANNFIRQQPNFVNHQIIRPHFVNQRVIRPINPQIQQMIHPNIIHRNRPDHEIQIAPIHHIPPAAVKQIHQISTASVSPPVHHVPAQAIAPIHRIPQLPNRDQTVFVHQQAEVPEIVRYPQPNVHSNEIPEHQSHDLDTGLFAEPIGHQQNLVVHENWHD